MIAHCPTCSCDDEPPPYRLSERDVAPAGRGSTERARREAIRLAAEAIEEAKRRRTTANKETPA